MVNHYQQKNFNSKIKCYVKIESYIISNIFGKEVNNTLIE